MGLTSVTAPFDQADLRKAFGRFPSGVVALCAEVEGELVGMAASSFVTVSLDPALVAFCVQHTSSTWPKLQSSRRIGISVLGEDHQDAALALASKTGNRFAGVGTVIGEGDAVFIDGASMWMNASITEQVTAGDHDIVVMVVNSFEIADAVAPIVFHGSRFRRLSVDAS